MFAKVCFVLLISYCSARSVNLSEDEIREPKALSHSKISFLSDLSQVYRVYEECNAKELGPCLKMKLITALDRLSRKIELPITDGLSLVKDEKSDSSNEIDNEVLEATLPRSLEEKDNRLDEIIADKIVNFFAGRSFQFKLSGIKDFQRSLQEDSRGKKGKYGSLMMIPLMMGGSMIPMALGTLALLAGKALIIAKLALTLSLIIGLKKLLNNDDHASSYQVVSHGGGGHYRRSLQDDEMAQSMAYRAYIPLTPDSSTQQYAS